MMTTTETLARLERQGRIDDSIRGKLSELETVCLKMGREHHYAFAIRGTVVQDEEGKKRIAYKVITRGDSVLLTHGMMKSLEGVPVLFMGELTGMFYTEGGADGELVRHLKMVVGTGPGRWHPKVFGELHAKLEVSDLQDYLFLSLKTPAGWPR